MRTYNESNCQASENKKIEVKDVLEFQGNEPAYVEAYHSWDRPFSKL